MKNSITANDMIANSEFSGVMFIFSNIQVCLEIFLKH